RRGLQKGESHSLNEKSREKERIAASRCGGDEGHCARRHDCEAEGHAALESGRAQDERGRQREAEIRHVKREGHEQGLLVGEFAGELEKWNQRAVQPGDETEDEIENADDGEREQIALSVSGSGRVVHVIASPSTRKACRCVCANPLRTSHRSGSPWRR